MIVNVREIEAAELDMINAISDRGMRATGKIYRFIKFVKKSVECFVKVFIKRNWFAVLNVLLINDRRTIDMKSKVSNMLTRIQKRFLQTFS